MATVALRRHADSLKAVLNTVVTIIALAVIVFGLHQFLAFLGTADSDENGPTRDGLIYFWLFVAGILYLVVSANFLGNGKSESGWRPFRDFWTQAGIRTSLEPFIVWLASLAFIPLVAMISVEQVPHQVYTPSYAIRLMDDGRVIPAGASVEAPRYQVTSVPVYLWHNDVPVAITVPTAAGAITLHLTLDLSLTPGDELSRVIRGSGAVLGEGNKDSRVDLQKTFFQRAARGYLNPQAGQLVSELQSGMTDGSESKLITRFTQLLTMHPQKRPAWLAHVSVKGVKVIQGEPIV